MIKIELIILLSCFVFFGKNAYSQIENDSIARDIIKESIIDKSFHNYLNFNKPIIRDSVTAVSVVEPILFGIYGKEIILRQKPYSIFHIDNYWVISGSLPNGSLGGVFLIIIDEKDSKAIRITHGK